MPVDISNFVRGLGEHRQRSLAAAVRAVDVFGERMIAQAQKMTPVLTGALQASGTTEPAVVSGDKVKKIVGFNTNYAAAVHEKLQTHHAIGQAKFLETALRNEGPKFSAFVGQQVKEAGGE